MTKSAMYRLLPTLVAVGLMLALSPAFAQMHHDHGEHAAPSSADEHQHDTHADEAASGMARCPYDGMLMKAGAMVERVVDGMPLYFCSEEQADAYMKDPERYRAQIALGHVHVNLNILTTKEYMGVMGDMGMGGMADMGEGKSHHVAVYFTQHGQDLQLDNVSLELRVSSPDAEAQVIPLKFNKMMKAFEASVELSTAKEYEFGVRITTPGVAVSL